MFSLNLNLERHCLQRSHVADLLSPERVKNFQARDGVDGGILDL